MTMHRLPIVAVASAATLFAAAASADIVSISDGGVILDPAPADFPQPDTFESSVVQGINERQSLVLDEDLQIDDLEDFIGVVDLSAGDTVDSHLLAFGPTTTESVSDIEIREISAAGPVMTVYVQMTPIYVDRAHGGSDIEITFENEILAVITNDQTLADTHAIFGLPGLNYPGFVSLYGFEATESTFSLDGNTIVFSGQASSPGDYFRVLTAIPAPGTGALAGAGLLAVARRRRP